MATVHHFNNVVILCLVSWNFMLQLLPPPSPPPPPPLVLAMLTSVTVVCNTSTKQSHDRHGAMFPIGFIQQPPSIPNLLPTCPSFGPACTIWTPLGRLPNANDQYKIPSSAWSYIRLSKVSINSFKGHPKCNFNFNPKFLLRIRNYSQHYVRGKTTQAQWLETVAVYSVTRFLFLFNIHPPWTRFQKCCSSTVSVQSASHSPCKPHLPPKLLSHISVWNEWFCMI